MPVRKATPAAKPAARTTTTRTTTAAKKTAAPARKAAPAAPKAPAAKPAAARRPAATKAAAPVAKKQKYTGHDVARAVLTAMRALKTAMVVVQGYAEEYQEELGGDLAEFLAPMGHGVKGTAADGPHRRARVAEEDRVIGELYNRDEVVSMKLVDLRELAADLVEQGVITEPKVKSVILEQMEEAGLFRGSDGSDSDEDAGDDEAGEYEDDGDAEEDEEDGDDSDDPELEDVPYTREELEAMSLNELRQLAKDNSLPYKGMDAEELVNSFIPGEEGEEEDEEEPEDEDEELDEEEEDAEEEEDDDSVGIDPEELPNMTVAQLLTICKQGGVAVPAAKRKDKKAIIAIILKAMED